ncbi:MAG TPA: L-threonylcarbamoyladenylate synthase [Gaiellaceae bacterium]|nr:L-threonylcarbamoyladenylate synthase [Gaiellaceae bacterium]
MATVAEAVAALRAGELAVLPLDTVYGLVASALSEAPARKLADAKGRDVQQPIALVAADLELLLECVPELVGQSEAIARALLPGPYTLVFPNPARRYSWLTGLRPETIGVRVPEPSGRGSAVLQELGAFAATSANVSGGPDPRSLAEVSKQIRSAAAALVDGGELPGTPSTVLDLTGAEPRVLREGAVPAAEALVRVAAALSR